MINYIERTINTAVMDEIEKGLLDEKAPKTIKLPVDDLLGDTIIAFLDILNLSNYILEKDIEGEFLTLQIDEKRCLNEYQKQDEEWENERNALNKQFLESGGVF
jgi:hypothetical protein